MKAFFPLGPPASRRPIGSVATSPALKARAGGTPAVPGGKKAFVLPLLALLLLTAAAPVPPSSWTQFRGDAQLTGRSSSSDLPAEPKPLWTFQAGEAIISTAAIVSGPKGTVYVGSLDGNLYAIDFGTGKLRWKYKATDEIKSSPAVREGVVYFGDEKGVLHAVDAATGARRWIFQAGGAIPSSPNFLPGCVLFGSYDNSLYCVSTKDGKAVWQLETDGYVHASPAVAGDSVIATGCDGFLHIVRARDGKELKKIHLGGYAGASAAVLGDRAFAGTFENQVVAVDLGSGAVAWRYEDPERQFPYYSSAAVRDGLLVVGGRDKRVHALDPKTGKKLWTHNARSAVDSSPVLSGDRVFAADKSGLVFALDARTGKVLWRFEAGSAIEASPAIAAGRLVIGTNSGLLYAFGARPKQ